MENRILEIVNLASRSTVCRFQIELNYGISFDFLTEMDLLSRIKTRVPRCIDHCNQTEECKYIPIFEQKVSQHKAKIGKNGLRLLDNEVSLINLLLDPETNFGRIINEVRLHEEMKIPQLYDISWSIIKSSSVRKLVPFLLKICKEAEIIEIENDIVKFRYKSSLSE